MNKKIPIKPFEIIRRMKDVPEILKWSRKKHLMVSGPEFWGIHHIYIDTSLKYTIFCLKKDGRQRMLSELESIISKLENGDKKIDSIVSVIYEQYGITNEMINKIIKDLLK